jgi:hypothetical protein
VKRKPIGRALPARRATPSDQEQTFERENAMTVDRRTVIKGALAAGVASQVL